MCFVWELEKITVVLINYSHNLIKWKFYPTRQAGPVRSCAPHFKLDRIQLRHRRTVSKASRKRLQLHLERTSKFAESPRATFRKRPPRTVAKILDGAFRKRWWKRHGTAAVTHREVPSEKGPRRPVATPALSRRSVGFHAKRHRHPFKIECNGLSQPLAAVQRPSRSSVSLPPVLSAGTRTVRVHTTR